MTILAQRPLTKLPKNRYEVLKIGINIDNWLVRNNQDVTSVQWGGFILLLCGSLTVDFGFRKIFPLENQKSLLAQTGSEQVEFDQ